MLFRSMHNGAGYFFNDDRCSGGTKSEDDTLACTHCQAGLRRRQWESDGGFKCVHCDQPLCNGCAATPIVSLKCEGPYEAKLQRAIDAQYRRDQNAKVLGI